MPVVDIHPHIVSPDTKQYPLAPLGGTQSTWSSERPTTYEMLLAAMDDAGVDKAAIVHSSTAYGYDNRYVADAVASVASRFTAVCSIDVMAPDAVKTFDYWLARGCTGMRLFTTGSTLPDQATWFIDPKTYPFWEHAAAKNIPVCMQMKLEGLPLLRQIMDRFPKVTIILDHLARAPFQDGAPYSKASEFLELAKYKQVYLKITPVNVTPKSWERRRLFSARSSTPSAPPGLHGVRIFQIPSARYRKFWARRARHFRSPRRRIRIGFLARPRSYSIPFWLSKGPHSW
jgi:L-fuconolactonase